MSTSKRDWIPADGDTFVTADGFIFNVFGYDHPEDRVTAFLKYIPTEFKTHFNIKYLDRTWNYGKLRLFRAEQLYTAYNYRTFIQAFKASFPSYVYFCPFKNKETISVPLELIKSVYVPNECLQFLGHLEKKDDLQKMTLDFASALSKESNINVKDFGVHGSVALGMHTAESDIDIVVYGASNFRQLEKTVDRLVKEGTLRYKCSNRLDAARRFKGKYRNRIFMYNAIRKPEEIKSNYGRFKYLPIKPIGFTCKVKDDAEAMFRPAVYRVESYEPIDLKSKVPEKQLPLIVTSMIGCYRNVARRGDKIEVSGILERVEDLTTGKTYHQVVVGSGTSEDEHVWPL